MLTFLLPIAFNFVVSNWRWLLIGGVVAGAGALWVYEKDKWIDMGKQEATQQIEQANTEEMNRAQGAQTTVDGCYAIGGDWDRDSGGV